MNNIYNFGTTSLLRVKPELTTNVKLVVDADGRMYLNSIDSHPLLYSSMYKSNIIRHNTYGKALSVFWKQDVKSDFIYDEPNYLDLSTAIGTDYRNQIDRLLLTGSKYASKIDYDNPSKFEYNTVISIASKDEIPDTFLIFKVDTNGYDKTPEYLLNNAILSATVDIANSGLGTFLYDSIVDRKDDLNISFSSIVTSSVSGIDIASGEYVKRSIDSDSFIKYENTFDATHRYATNQYVENKMVMSNMFNLSFLYDDKEGNDAWRASTHMGFYANLENIATISLYKPPRILTDLYLTNNYFTKFINGINTYVDPFYYRFNKNKKNVVEFDSEYYDIIRDEIGFKIVDFDIDIEIGDNTSVFNNGIKSLSENIFSSLVIDNFDSFQFCLIELFGKYKYRIIKENGIYKLLTHDLVSVIDNRINIIKKDGTVINEDIIFLDCYVYGVEFIPISDYDTDILETNYGLYENNNDVLDDNISSETKLSQLDLSFNSSPRPYTTYVFNNRLIGIPVISEYVASSEIYRTDVPVFRKNGIIKWGYANSISSNDYPYLLNNNEYVAGIDNRAPSISTTLSDQTHRNLDFFYTFCVPNYNYGYDADIKIDFQSLNIPKNGFNLLTYMDDTNYFDSLFDDSIILNDKKFRYRKFSKFINNETIFRGAKIKSNHNLDNFRFTVIFDKLTHRITDKTALALNNSWNRIKIWGVDRYFSVGDIIYINSEKIKGSNGYGFNGYSVDVLNGVAKFKEYTYPDGSIEPFNGIAVLPKGINSGINELYICTVAYNVGSGAINFAPPLSNFASYPVGGSNTRTIFFQKNRAYTRYIPGTTSYEFLNDNNNYLRYITFYNNNYYYVNVDLGSSNLKTPNHTTISSSNGLVIKEWILIEVYQPSKIFTTDTLVIQDGDLYYYSVSLNTLSLLHSFKQSAKTYVIGDIVKIENTFFINLQQSNMLRNGVNIYKNNDDKSVIVHIYSNENIFGDVKNRNTIYKNAISNLLTLSSVSSYINSRTGLPFTERNVAFYEIKDSVLIPNSDFSITIESPDVLDIVNNSLTIDVYKDNIFVNTEVKSEDIISDNQIKSMLDINKYDNTETDVKFISNNDKLISDRSIYRFSGKYSPILKEIPLFDREYKMFDMNLHNFGMTNLIINKAKSEPFTYDRIIIKLDEFGYREVKQSIFKSPMDKKYYKKYE